MNKKDRKNSGKYTPRLSKPITLKYKDIHKYALEPKEEYDEWKNYRDGFRDKKYLKWKKTDKAKEIKLK